MDKNYKPSERQKKCMKALCYQGKEMNKTLCLKTDGAVSNEDCEGCSEYKSKFIEYPITVSKINYNEPVCLEKPGGLVKIKPCAKEYEGKTFLGILLGDIPSRPYVTYDEKTQELNVSAMTNPGIYVFELKKIVFGCESWWQKINSVKDFTEISEDDIENVWYVQMLRAMEAQPKKD